MVARKKPKKASTGDTIRERPESVRAKKLPNIYLRDKIYIPTRFVDEDVVIRQYTHCEFDDNVCRTCDLRSARPCNDCYECQWGGLKGTFLMAGHKVVSGRPYYTVPLGDIDNVEYKLGIDFDDFNLVDKTTRKKFAYPIKYTGQLYDYQEAPVRNILKYKMGILKSKPRTGKCTRKNEIVDTSVGQLDMERLWELYGKEGHESVELDSKLYTKTAFGKERISWIHRKKSKCLELTTHIGHKLGATPEHPVFVVTPDLEVVERRMDELRVGDWIVSKPNTAMVKRKKVSLVRIPESEYVFTTQITQPKFMTEDLAYVLGCLVANGTLTTAKENGHLAFTSNDNLVSAQYMRKMDALFGITTIRSTRRDGIAQDVIIDSRQLARWLEANGLSMSRSAGKSIPDPVLRGDKAIHLAFLSGYLSCDSSIYHNFIEQITASEKLHKQLAVMFMSLGCVATARVTHKAATNGSGIKRPYYCLTLAANNMQKLLSQVELHKERPVNVGRNAGARVYGDADNIPYVVDHINALPLHKREYYEGKHSLNKHGTLARNTLLRVKRELLPAKLRKFLKYADGVYFQQVTEIKKLPKQWVYDLTVEGSHTFIASGFMVHNTVMATAAICKYGQRAIIMADQKDFLDGFLETFHAVTNVLQLEEECGHKLVGFPKTLKDFDTLQVILITYQQLIKNTKAAKDKLRKLRTLYGVLCVDEVHRTCAPQFSRILGLMTTRVRFGLSATPHRKDSREALAFHMIGPIIAKTNAEALKPKIAVHYTPDTVKSRNQFSGQAGWTRFCQFLAKHEDRNMMIVDQAIKDLKKGRNIVIPIMFTEHAEKLKREINAAYGEEIAEVFLGGSKHAKFRKQIVDDARAGKIRVVIGIRRLVQIGINVPQWDTLYYVKPLNNAPNWEQESYRILTPLPDKQPPLIRMFVDRNMNRSLGCFKSTLQTSLEFGHELLPKSKERLRDDYGSAIYDVSAKAKKSVKTGRDSSGVLGRTF